MKALQEFFKREEQKEIERKKIIKREHLFKYTHVNYWALKMDDETIEFWAFHCTSEKKWYLGKSSDGEVKECDGFYAHTLPWSIQKGGVRAFEMWSR